METNPLIIYPLWALVILGLVGVAKVSLDNFNGLSCPSTTGGLRLHPFRPE